MHEEKGVWDKFDFFFKNKISSQLNNDITKR